MRRSRRRAFAATTGRALTANFHDDEQRLFVVYRNDEGHTKTRRIKVKPRPDGEKLKLSELWMRGHLGGLPRNF